VHAALIKNDTYIEKIKSVIQKIYYRIPNQLNLWYVWILLSSYGMVLLMRAGSDEMKPIKEVLKKNVKNKIKSQFVLNKLDMEKDLEKRFKESILKNEKDFENKNELLF
jgi:hypothetical protein